MQIKNTPWEKRNLGVESSVEFIVGQDEYWDDVCDELQSHNEIYQVLHIQSGNSDVFCNASSIGFIPVEMNIQLTRKLDSVEIPRIYKRFDPYLTCEVASNIEEKKILNLIKEGTIFSTDKVARDPNFGVKAAGQRYAYWTKDVIDKGATLLCMKYKNKMVAFDVLIDEKNGTADAFLGGVVPEFLTSGLGFVPVYMITKFAMEKGYKRIITGVSSNNIAILKLHEMFGYTIDSMSYCMIKHIRKR